VKALRALSPAAALLAALALCGGAAAMPGTQWGTELRVAEQPFGLTLVENGRTLVAQDMSARLRYQLASTGEQFKLTDVVSSRGGVYQVATSEPGRTATVSIARRPHGFRVSVALRPAANVARVYDAFEVRPGEHFLGGGERGATVDLNGEVLPVAVSNSCSYAPIPFFMSSGRWGIRLASQNVAALAFPGSQGGTGCSFGSGEKCTFPPLAARAEVCVQGARLDEDLYLGSLPELLDAYLADTGRPHVPAPAELELVKWRDEAAGPADVLEDIDRFRSAGIPIGGVLVDNPWETCVGTLQFDTARFPDPQGLIRQVHELGLRFMLWVSPKVICPGGYPASSLLGTQANQVLDLRKPDVLAIYRARLERLAALGVDGVKGDRGDEIDLAAGGPTFQNDYPLLFAHAVLDAFPSGGGSIFRAGTVGSQSVLPGLWAGDQPGDWVGLQLAIRQGQTAAMSGFPTWGSDVGGYASAGLTADVFARWAQVGAVSPVLEVGGAGPNATPWQLGAEAMAALQGAAILHYELFPYLYDLLARGQPVLRPLGYAYPGDVNAWKAELQFLVGPDLLAAPVTGPGTTPRVYLPAGAWVDLYRGTLVQGDIAYTRETPLTQFPLYVRAGAVIPFNLRTAGRSWWGVEELTHRGRAGWLATDGARLDLRDQPRNVQIFVPLRQQPRTVTIGDREVAWTWNDGPFPGVVIRLHGPAVHGIVSASR
jgi:alpha-D-xyloside xylohydrolase